MPQYTPPIVEYATKGSSCEVRRLLDNGANIEQTDHSGFTALHYAAANGQIDTVRFLVGRGANVNALSTHARMTPLRSALTRGHHDVAEYLRSVGALDYVD